MMMMFCALLLVGLHVFLAISFAILSRKRSCAYCPYNSLCCAMLLVVLFSTLRAIQQLLLFLPFTMSCKLILCLPCGLVSESLTTLLGWILLIRSSNSYSCCKAALALGRRSYRKRRGYLDNICGPTCVCLYLSIYLSICLSIYIYIYIYIYVNTQLCNCLFFISVILHLPTYL